MDGDDFLTYMLHWRNPILRPGDIVILDNLKAHEVAGIRKGLENAGARLWYLPAYSP